MGEPPVELGRAAARVGAGNERLIAQFDTKIECFRIHNYLPRVLVIFENLADDLINVECVGTGNFDRAVYRATAASATAVATSSAAIGWDNECDRRTVSPSAADCAMPRRNSKNRVARTIVYGIGAFLISFSCASLARK